jgi:hypothetical protein
MVIVWSQQPLRYAIFIAFQRTTYLKAYNLFYIIVPAVAPPYRMGGRPASCWEGGVPTKLAVMGLPLGNERFKNG